MKGLQQATQLLCLRSSDRSSWAFSCFMSSSRVAVWHVSTTVECQCDAAPVTKLALPQGEMSKQILHCLIPCGDKHRKDVIEMKILSELGNWVNSLGLNGFSRMADAKWDSF